MKRVLGPGLGAVRARSLVFPIATVCAIALAGPPGAGAATPPRCKTSQLRLQFVRAEGATGGRFWDLAFKNKSSARCMLRGFPRVQLLNKHGKAIHTHVRHVTGFKVRTVTVAPGKRAFFTFRFTDGAFCLPHHFFAYGLRVFPPRQGKGLLLLHGKMDVCSNSAGVYPIRPKLNQL